MQVDTLEIRWPSGTVDRITNIGINQNITVEEGEGMITAVENEFAQPSIPDS